MKSTILPLALLFSFTIFSCNKIKDASIVNVDTTLKVDVPMSDQNAVSILKSANFTDALFPIAGTSLINLKDNYDLKNYVNSLEGMTINDVLSNITGVTADDEFSNLSVKATLEGTDYTILDAGTKVFTLSNSNDLGLSLEVLKSIVSNWKIVGYDKQITFTVTGFSKVAIGNRIKIAIQIPAKVGYSLLQL
jgi:hypothetical protein